MATKKESAKAAPAKKAVTRVKVASKVERSSKPARRQSRFLTIVTAPFRYVGGSFRELREVRWPNRRTAWGLTLAVLLFSGALTVFIVLIDLLFDFLTKKVLL